MSVTPMPVTFTGIAEDTARERGAAYSRLSRLFLFHPQKVEGPATLAGRDHRVQLSSADLARLIGQIPAKDLADAGEDVVTAYMKIRLFLLEGGI